MSRNYRIQDSRIPHFVTLTVVEWLNVFKHDHICNLFVDSLNYCIINKELEVHAWVLMKNHAHLVISSKNILLSNILRDFKKYTSKSIIRELLDQTNNIYLNRFRINGLKKTNVKTYQVWMHHNQSVTLYNDYLFEQKIEYIHYNPVNAGYVCEPSEYKYSSAIDYKGGKGLVIINMM